MDIGAIGFHDRSKVHSIRVKKDHTIVNALKKTKEVLFSDTLSVVGSLLIAVYLNRNDIPI